jgi:uncharacterized membrane protein
MHEVDALGARETPGIVQAPQWVRDGIDRLEEDTRLDPVVDRMERVAATVTAGPRGAVLRGEAIGHALHPLLTDFPLGCWLAAHLLDLTGGRRSRRAAQRLIGLGLLFVPATAAAGLADWATTEHARSKRVGAAHALGNTAVTLLYFKSWRARRAGRGVRGVGYALAGGALAWVTGYLGGHLSFGRSVGHGLRGLDLPAEASSDGPARELVTQW